MQSSGHRRLPKKILFNPHRPRRSHYHYRDRHHHCDPHLNEHHQQHRQHHHRHYHKFLIPIIYQ